MSCTLRVDSGRQSEVATILMAEGRTHALAMDHESFERFEKLVAWLNENRPKVALELVALKIGTDDNPFYTVAPVNPEHTERLVALIRQWEAGFGGIPFHLNPRVPDGEIDISDPNNIRILVVSRWGFSHVYKTVEIRGAFLEDRIVMEMILVQSIRHGKSVGHTVIDAEERPINRQRLDDELQDDEDRLYRRAFAQLCEALGLQRSDRRPGHQRPIANPVLGQDQRTVLATAAAPTGETDTDNES